MIDFAAREAHYADHLAPIWRALPPDLRGRFLAPLAIADHIRTLGVEPTEYASRIPPSRAPIVVAATQDYRRALAAGRSIVMASHGAGQAYIDSEGRRSRAFAGGPGRGNAALFLAVNDYQAGCWRRAYPRVPCEVVGCPKLEGRPPECGPRPGPVCVSFHWDCLVAPETRTAWPHYRRAVLELAGQVELVGHAHPRIASLLRPQFEDAGIPFIDTFDEVLDAASVYVADNSSTLFEFAAVRGPVVVLNAPWYRRSVNHGGRFWDWAHVGLQVDHPAELAAAVSIALEDPPEVRRARRRIVREVYPHDDAAARAARAIADLVRRPLERSA